VEISHLKKKPMTKNTAEWKQTSGGYWTSASSQGFGCLSKWGWCSTDTMFQPNVTSWANGKPSSPYDKQCAQVKPDTDPKKMTIEELGCGEGRFFICEVCANNFKNEEMQTDLLIFIG
jgi:hypothetical protein